VISLEDAIEKRAGTLGYSLDVSFVDVVGPDVFTVGLDTSQWTTAGNFAGDSVGIAHELHHLLGLGDRYDYIVAHAGNAKMKIPARLLWFRQEFEKVVPNDPDSIMKTGLRVPLDDDVCRVAGRKTRAEIDACVATRSDARAKRLKPGIDLALEWLSKAGALPDAASDAAAARVFTKPPGLKERRSAIAAAPSALSAANVQFFSSLTDVCATRPAFARAAASRKIGLCPSFPDLSALEQGRLLLVEALHLQAVGTIDGEKDCPAGCNKPCGEATNAKAWARFIECSAGP